MPGRKTGGHITSIMAPLVAIAGLVCAKDSLAQAIAYTISVLPAAANHSGQIPSQLNNLGDVAGRAVDSSVGGTRATIWSRNTLQPQGLGALCHVTASSNSTSGGRGLGVFRGGEYSSASAINDAGEAAGASNTGNSVVPFIWNPKGGLQSIPLLRGDNCGQAFGINKYGHVVGYSSGPNGARAFLWARSTGVQSLGSLPGGSYSRARRVNDSDEAVGTSASPAGNRAVLWTKSGNLRDLGTLPGDSSSEAMAINNAGDVVGYSKGPGGMRAFLWTAANGMQDLGVLSGGHSSRALAISDSGDVVGTSTSSSGDRAFIWTKQAGMTDLNSAVSTGLGAVLMEAHAINNSGEILVMGKVAPEPKGGTAPPKHEDCAPGPPSTFLLIPIP